MGGRPLGIYRLWRCSLLGGGTHTRTPYLVPFGLRPADAHSRACVI